MRDPCHTPPRLAYYAKKGIIQRICRGISRVALPIAIDADLGNQENGLVV